MENLDIGENVENIGKKWKPILVMVFGLVVIGLLGLLALNMVSQVPISMTFEDKTVKAGDTTLLKTVIVNTGEIDEQDVTIEILPESEVVNVIDAIRTELTIGSKARREFEFEVGVIESATPGTYKLTARVSGIGEEDLFATTYLEVE